MLKKKKNIHRERSTYLTEEQHNEHHK